MAYRAVCVAGDPLGYFLQENTEKHSLRVSDVILRYNHRHKDVFSHLIRITTNSKWSHSALIYLLSDPDKGFNNTFIVEARTKGIRVASWRNEVFPLKQFTIGIKRPRLDWYVETPYETSKHDPRAPEDTYGINYLRHVRGIAVDQINGLFDHKTVGEISALYIERASKRHLGNIPQVAEAADTVANFFKKWDESEDTSTNVLRFICSGLIQYSFFEALCIRIAHDLKVPEHRKAALSNLSNMHRIIFRDDPEGIIPNYVRQVQEGKLDVAHHASEDVLDFLKTATPADFNNSSNLEWRYIILEGVVWRIDEAPGDYQPKDAGEEAVLALLQAEHRA